MKRIFLSLAVSAMTLLVASPIAMAADGEGLYGRTNDKVITFFCFGVIIFFALFVVVMSILQNRLETRKDRAREDIERLRKP
jgi:putative copper export protein